MTKIHDLTDQGNNNLYGWAISECLSMGKFELIDVEGFDLKFSNNSSSGCY